MERMQNIVVRDARISNRNFAGKEIPPYTPAGKRSFTVIFDGETAQQLLADGWNVKLRGDTPDSMVGYLNVAVAYNNYPPQIYKVLNGQPMLYSEDTVADIDNLEIEKVDLVIRPYEWANRDGSKGGVKAYLKTMYVTPVVDELYAEYNNIPMSASVTADLDLPFEL